MTFQDDLEPEFIAKLVARDERAFNELVRVFERRIFGMLVRMIGNPTEAEDLTHEVFIQVFKSIGSFRGESKLSTWIYRITVNLCKNRMKYLKVRHTGDSESIDEIGERVTMGDAQRSTVSHVERPDDAYAGKEMARIVREAILEIPEHFRECLILRDVEDLRYDEIASVTGLTEGTVKSRIFRAREELRLVVERKMGGKKERT